MRTLIAIAIAMGIMLGELAGAGEIQVLSVLDARSEDNSAGVGVEVLYLHHVRDWAFAEVFIGEGHSMVDTCSEGGYEEEGGCRGRYVGVGAGIERALPWGLIGRADVVAKHLRLECDQDYTLDDTWVVGLGGSITAMVNDRVGILARVRYEWDQAVQPFRGARGDTGMDFDAGGFKMGVGVAIRF